MMWYFWFILGVSQGRGGWELMGQLLYGFKPVKVLAVQTFRRGRASLEAEIFLQVDLKLSVRVQHF